MVEANLEIPPTSEPNAFPLQELGIFPRQPSQESNLTTQTPMNDVEEPEGIVQTGIFAYPRAQNLANEVCRPGFECCVQTRVSHDE